MKLLECLENEAFNELINFSLGEVGNLLNQFIYYVSFDKEEDFISEASAAKTKYEEELARIEKYSKAEYTDLVNSGVDIPEYDEPSFMIKEVELQIKSQLIGLIKKYYDRDLFEQNRSALYGQETFKEESIETPHELWVSLNVHKNHAYSLLSMLGYYQRHYRYFLSSLDFFKICAEYSRQVYRINKNLGLNYEFIDIFISDKRLDKKYIDIDKLSLIGLLQPYLKHNTHEINKIIEIMMKNLRGYNGGIAWESAMKEVNQFIAECEAKGIMKRL
jgi:hypothetical protein